MWASVSMLCRRLFVGRELLTELVALPVDFVFVYVRFVVHFEVLACCAERVVLLILHFSCSRELCATNIGLRGLWHLLRGCLI